MSLSGDQKLFFNVVGHAWVAGSNPFEEGESTAGAAVTKYDVQARADTDEAAAVLHSDVVQLEDMI